MKISKQARKYLLENRRKKEARLTKEEIEFVKHMFNEEQRRKEMIKRERY